MNQTLDSLFHYYQSAISLRSYRQETLASNVANADTPGYKARDFNFSQALSGALQQGAASGVAAASGAPGAVGAGLALTSSQHLSGAASLDPYSHAAVQAVAKLQYRIPAQDSIDGNTVDLDVERAAFANNAIHYEANLTELSGEIKNLISAMQQG